MISTKKGQRAAALATAALTATAVMPAIIAPEAALAADETRTFTWADGEAQPSIPDTVQINGQTYQLKSTSNPVQARNGGAPINQQFTRTVDSTIPADKGNNIADSAPSSVHIDDNGFVGDIPRTGIDYTPIYRTDVKHYDETRTYTVTERNEGAIAQTITANGHTYSISNVTFADGQKDSQGNVLTYIATATYGTDVSNQVLDHYNISAHYSGTLSKNAQDGSWTMTATYSSPDQNANTNENESAGVTSSFNDTGTFGAPENLNANEEVNANSSNPFENGSKATDKNENKEANNNDGAGNNIPIIPIAGGIGVIALIGIIAAIASKKNKNKQGDAYVPMTATETTVEATQGSVSSGTSAINDDDFIPQAQLIELIPIIDDETGETEAQQEPRANLTVDLSNDKTIPTIIYFPPVLDAEGNRHELTASADDSQFWIAIDDETVAQSASDKVIVSTDDGYELYRGDIDTQFPLMRDETIATVNGTAEDLDGKDIQNELDAYDEKRDEIAAQKEQQAGTDQQEQEAEQDDNEQESTDATTYDSFCSENDNEPEHETFDMPPFMMDNDNETSEYNEETYDTYDDNDGFGEVMVDDDADYEPVEVEEAEMLDAEDDNIFDNTTNEQEENDKFDDAATTQFDESEDNKNDDDDFNDLLNSIK